MPSMGFGVLGHYKPGGIEAPWTIWFCPPFLTLLDVNLRTIEYHAIMKLIPLKLGFPPHFENDWSVSEQNRCRYHPPFVGPCLLPLILLSIPSKVTTVTSIKYDLVNKCFLLDRSLPTTFPCCTWRRRLFTAFGTTTRCLSWKPSTSNWCNIWSRNSG